MYVLGIDGGGTKTTGVIANTKGDIFKEVTVGGSNLNSTEKTVVIRELTKLIDQLKVDNNDVFAQVTNVFAGMSGAGNTSNREELHEVITSLLPDSATVNVDNDAITALYSGTLGEPGIVQIAGTGAITYGVNSNGNRDRVGGWGHLFSDQGSGYAIGRDGLRAAFMAFDGLSESTYLNQLLVSHFQIKELPELVQVIYQSENPKELIASLSKLVVEAVDEGDHIAKNIISKNGTHLGEAISTLAKKMFPADSDTKAIPVVLAGGLFNRYDLFKIPIEKAIKDNYVHGKITIPKVLPVGGAVIAALREKNIEINKDFVSKFTTTIVKVE